MKRWLPFTILLAGCTTALPKEDYSITITSHVCDQDGGSCRKETQNIPFTKVGR